MEPHRNSHRLSQFGWKIAEYARLVRLDRPIGIYLLLWPTLWALWIAARGVPNLRVLLVFCLGVILMRSAGCAINDYADRHLDAHVARTKDRPLAAGRLAPAEALSVFLVLSVSAFALVLLLNPLTVCLSLGAILLAATYPYMKRFHYLPQVHLGAAFGWAVPMAFTAQTGQFPPAEAWLLFLSTVLWATAYDTMYAMADREDDLKIGIKSTAILFGESDRLVVAAIQVLLILALVLVGLQAQLGSPYYLGLLVASGFLIYQQRLIFRREPRQCFRAFVSNNHFGAAVFVAIALNYAMES